MCMISAVVGSWEDKWGDSLKSVGTTFKLPECATKEQVDQLRKELTEIKDVLKAAKIYDEKTGQPDCHNKEKSELLKKVAKALGIDLKDVI